MATPTWTWTITGEWDDIASIRSSQTTNQTSLAGTSLHSGHRRGMSDHLVRPVQRTSSTSLLLGKQQHYSAAPFDGAQSFAHYHRNQGEQQHLDSHRSSTATLILDDWMRSSDQAEQGGAKA